MDTMATGIEAEATPSELAALSEIEAVFNENLQAAKAELRRERQVALWKRFGTVGFEFYRDSAVLNSLLSVNAMAECRRNVHATMLPF